MIGRLAFFRNVLYYPFLCVGWALIPIDAYSEGGRVAHACGDKTINVLFIGNSYVIYNNLPNMLNEMSKMLGSKKCISATAASKPGYSLQLHWENRGAIDAIHNANWSYVVLQEQSLIPISQSDVFLEFATRFGGEVAGTKAKLVLFSTWAYQYRPEDLIKIKQAYYQVAKSTGAEIAPVGQAWSNLIEITPDVRLYANDGHHPSLHGSYVAACTFLNLINPGDSVKCPSKAEWGVSVEMKSAVERSVSRALKGGG